MRKKFSKIICRFFPLLALAMMFLLLSGCNGQATNKATDTSAESSAKLTVTMLNVGQGDAVLVDSGAQKILIDTGDVDEREKLRRELAKLNVKTLDKVILTHPHADHIGGMDVLLKDCVVKEVLDNGMPSTSPVYRAYMKELKEQKISRRGLTAGETLDFGNGVKFIVLSPDKEIVKAGQAKGYKHNPNDESVVGKLSLGDFAMLFTGDAEKEIEAELVKTYGDELRSQVLKSPHHGSKTSSSQKFLEAARPEVAVISCGVDNEYGHPHNGPLERYEKFGAKVYRTDKNGTIQIVTDGKTYDVKGEKS